MSRRFRVGNIVFRDPILLCGVLYLLLYFDASGWMRLSLLTAFLHESGHIAIYCLQTHRMPLIEVTWTGFCMRTGTELTLWQRFWLAAAGPGTNFLLAGIWALRLAERTTVQGSAFWAANLLTGAFNLLPVQPLDGAQMLECLRILFHSKQSGQK